MELGDYFRVLGSRWLSVTSVALAVLAATAAATLLMTPQYSSSTRMFFSVQGGESVSDLAQGSTFTEKQMASYAEVARSPLVLDGVAESLGLDTDSRSLAAQLDVSIAANTTILVVSATDSEPARARDIANAVADELSATVGGLNPDRPDGSEAVRATMLSEAQLPTSPSAPNVTRNLALGLVLGLILGVGVALLREVLDTKIRNEGDVSSVTDISTLGSVPIDEAKSDHPVFMHDDANGQRAEAIRRLRTNLQFVDFSDRPSSILVTSSVSNEGKTTTAINLAASLADAGSRVILVDADLRRPSIAKYMGFEGRVGLTTVLIGKATVGDVVQPWQGTSLDVLASGRVPPNPSELLGSRAMSRLLAELSTTYDVVVIDSPPLLPVTDAAILSKMVGGTIVVAGADSIHKAQLRTSLESLAKVDADVLGLVLNKVERKSHSNYYGDYYGTEDPSLTGSRSRRSARKAGHTLTAAPAAVDGPALGQQRSSWPGEQVPANRG